MKEYIERGGSLDELVDELHQTVEGTMEKDTLRELLLEKEAMVLYMDLLVLEPYKQSAFFEKLNERVKLMDKK